MKQKIQVPFEAEEQENYFSWIALNTLREPCLALAYHPPNGGSRHKLEAIKLKRQGVKKGVPDIVLPASSGEYHGLYIELKRLEGGKVSEDQKKFINGLKKEMYFVTVCKGWKEAAKVTKAYLELGGRGKKIIL
jgi:VRR-NUC domain.